jgi:hypothetical protein
MEVTLIVTVRVIRDGADFVYVFVGDYPEGFESFGWEGRWANYPAVFVRGEKGDRMPLLAAADWLRDRGIEPGYVGGGRNILAG